MAPRLKNRFALPSTARVSNICLILKALHSIKAVAQKTGLTPHVIRIWEKRYRAVKPARTGTNRRLYTDRELDRLGLLRELTRAGHNIGQIAALPTEKLRKLTLGAVSVRNHDGSTFEPIAISLLDQAISAVRNLDTVNLEEILNQGSVELGTQGILQKLIAPLAQALGDLWRDGNITAAHEHFASAVIRIFLGHAAKSFVAPENAPVLVVATPHGQLHELGALLVGTAAANLGWRVAYLGASLPAAEIAGAARQSDSRAIALSIVYPEDDPRLAGELEKLRRLVPEKISLLVGGRAAPAYLPVLESIGALQITDLAHLCATLDQLRKPSKNRR